MARESAKSMARVSASGPLHIKPDNPNKYVSASIVGMRKTNCRVNAIKNPERAFPIDVKKSAVITTIPFRAVINRKMRMYFMANS